MTHTPGPWHTSLTHLGAAVDVGAEDGTNITLVYGPRDGGDEKFEANARLIAAAPELMEALEECNTLISCVVEAKLLPRGFLHEWENDNGKATAGCMELLSATEIRDNARAAIVKARGES